MGCESQGRLSYGEDGEEEGIECSRGGGSWESVKAMAKKVDTERGREIYHQRIGIVEPVFANIRAVKRLDRFTLRGKLKVNTQWVLYCMVHNIGKIMSYGFA